MNKATIDAGYTSGMCGDCCDKNFVSVDLSFDQQTPTSLQHTLQPNAGIVTSASTCGSADCCSSTTSEALPCV